MRNNVASFMSKNVVFKTISYIVQKELVVQFSACLLFIQV
jgi:hypothetical protein